MPNVIGLTLVLGGCTADISSIPQGVYSGTVACLLEARAPDGQTGELEFAEVLLVEVKELDTLVINGVPAFVGEIHTRSIPTAEMGFEIVDMRHFRGGVEITYEPRPTLPGIEAQGRLIETYRWENQAFSVTANSNLILRDVDGETALTIACVGMLPVTQAAP